VSLATPPKVEKLQAALHAKAKGSTDYRFYMLYDKVYRTDILAHAYWLCRANAGAPGIDGITFDDIKAYGEEQWLDGPVRIFVSASRLGLWFVGYPLTSGMRSSNMIAKWFRAAFQLRIGIFHFFDASLIAR